MELIKKIKQAEAQAQEIIKRAGAETAGRAEKGRQNRLQAVEETERERKRAIEAAVAAAQSQGLAEIKQLKAQAEKDRQELRGKVNAKMATAVEKVMDYLKK